MSKTKKGALIGGGSGVLIGGAAAGKKGAVIGGEGATLTSLPFFYTHFAELCYRNNLRGVVSPKHGFY